MSTTRAEVLQKLRQWGAPVAPATLAHWMGWSPLRVSDCLTALYSRDLVDRKPQPARERGQRGQRGQRGRMGNLYYAKGLQS